MPPILTVIAMAAALVGSPQAQAQTTPAADPAAYALLKQAHDNRCAFPTGFAGFTADVTMNDNGPEVTGTLTYAPGSGLKLALSGATKQQEQWAHEQLGSALGHRTAEEFGKGDGSNALTLTEDDHSPLGRKIALNDRFKSYYRVRDGRISEVTRSMGPTRFTITVLDDKVVEGGKYLPSQFVVTYFDGATGAIKQVDEYSDGFSDVGGVWLPTSRRVVTAENGGFTTRSIALANVKLLPATAAAAR